MKLDDFDYTLPPERIAAAPAAERDGARLLVHEIGAGRTQHLFVRDLPGVLAAGDLLVFNDTRVRAARLMARRPEGPDGGGGRVECLLVERLDSRACLWRAMVRPAGRLRAGERLSLERGGPGLRALERLAGPDGRPGPEWTLAVEAPPDWERSRVEAHLEAAGELPLPPYIARPGGPVPADRERYQTVFARETGAVAAPTAGLHFTPELLERLARGGVDRAFVTLHVGPGTFRPVTAEDPREHRMDSESFHLSPETADTWRRTRSKGGRVVAVGTTVVRTLESALAPGEPADLRPGPGSTALYVLPGHRFRAVDALLTNFHLPKSTLLMLVSAFAGRERVLALYAEAVAEGYRFYSYGDAMLLLP